MRFLLSLLTLGAFFAQLPSAQAGQRYFAFTYGVLTAPAGTVELENWVTWKQGNDTEDSYAFRHEVEFGVTDRLEVSLYLADWSYNDEEGAKYEHSGVEAVYNLTNPTTDWLGSAVYGEVLLGDEVFEIEGKLLLQKNFGPLVVAYNLVLEAKWEGPDFEEREGEFAQTFGLSYELTPHLSIGVEAVHEIPLPDWRDTEDSIFLAGPNISVRAGRFFATAAVLAQLTDVDGEAGVESRMIMGVSF